MRTNIAAILQEDSSTTSGSDEDINFPIDTNNHIIGDLDSDLNVEVSEDNNDNNSEVLQEDKSLIIENNGLLDQPNLNKETHNIDVDESDDEYKFEITEEFTIPPTCLSNQNEYRTRSMNEHRFKNVDFNMLLILSKAKSVGMNGSQADVGIFLGYDNPDKIPTDFTATLNFYFVLFNESNEPCSESQ